MAEAKKAEPVKLICGIIAVDERAIGEARRELEALYGPIDLESDVIPFTFTDYYREEMADNLLRKFFAFKKLIDPAQIAAIKLQTNALEEKHVVESKGVKKRTVNLDPGYVCASRLVLATAKDFSHRIYLSDGIYAEVTLNFRKDGVITHPWTFPDFKSDKYADFFMAVRRRYMEQRVG